MARNSESCGDSAAKRSLFEPGGADGRASSSSPTPCLCPTSATDTGGSAQAGLLSRHPACRAEMSDDLERGQLAATTLEDPARTSPRSRNRELGRTADWAGSSDGRDNTRGFPHHRNSQFGHGSRTTPLRSSAHGPVEAESNSRSRSFARPTRSMEGIRAEIRERGRDFKWLFRLFVARRRQCSRRSRGRGASFHIP